MKAVFTGGGNVALVVSTLGQHAIKGAGPDDSEGKLPADATPVGSGLYTAKAGGGGTYVFAYQGRQGQGTPASRFARSRRTRRRSPSFVDRADLPLARQPLGRHWLADEVPDRRRLALARGRSGQHELVVGRLARSACGIGR